MGKMIVMPKKKSKLHSVLFRRKFHIHPFFVWPIASGLFLFIISLIFLTGGECRGFFFDTPLTADCNAIPVAVAIVLGNVLLWYTLAYCFLSFLYKRGHKSLTGGASAITGILTVLGLIYSLLHYNTPVLNIPAQMLARSYLLLMDAYMKALQTVFMHLYP